MDNSRKKLVIYPRFSQSLIIKAKTRNINMASAKILIITSEEQNMRQSQIYLSILYDTILLCIHLYRF